MIAFDTLAYCKKLQAAGMPAEQAEAFTWALQDAIRPVDAEELAIPEISWSCAKTMLRKWPSRSFLSSSG